jgi:UDPglucose 6-dehydrogenase
MQVCVYGLWHLGCVTAGCIAAAGHTVRALDPDKETVNGLNEGKVPISEPGLAELLSSQREAGRLSFDADPTSAVAGCEVIWVTFDTPVDDDDNADVDYVIGRIRHVLPLLQQKCLVVISSQLPVGSCRKLKEYAANSVQRPDIRFAYSPENLRLGKAIEVFSRPDRIVLGVRSPEDRELLGQLLSPITDRLEWMSVESAEMTKHALNAFLAVSVTYANEIAAICEKVNADAKEVERGLKSERRIGPAAYLAPGPAFAGGTLARDVAFLNDVAAEGRIDTPVLAAVRPSNTQHSAWPRRTLQGVLGSLEGQKIAVWGLTYKPGTDTLRRSSSVEFCRSIASLGAVVRAYDPAIRALPPDLAFIELQRSAIAAVQKASALVIMTPWSEFRDMDMGPVLERMAVPVVLDPGRVLPAASVRKGMRYFAVGSADHG